MKAAVVSSFGSPPRYTDVPVPRPTGEHQELVDVVAAGLHPRVRSQATGSHYTSSGELPLVPGIDGVGRDADGRLRYFVLPDTPAGAMAEQTVIDRRRSIPLPDDVDPVAVAAAMNPAMSSWIALRRRIGFRPGQDALVVGATGNAGRLAVQVLRILGAGRLVAAGRDPQRLAELEGLGATATVALTGADDDVAAQLGAAAGDVDVVLDYVWGEPAARAMAAVVTARADRGAPLTWVQIGSVAGPTAPLPSAALRAARLDVVGSGQGSVATRDIVAELPDLAAEVARGALRADARAVPLADVEAVWTEDAGTQRIVLTPGA